MISNWETLTIGDFLSHRKGFAFKSTQYKTEGRKIARVSNFTQRSIDTDGCNCIDEGEANQFSEYILKAGDVVIATVGSWPTNPASVVGRAVRVPEEANGLLLNQNAVRLRSNEHVSQQFLFYLLSAEHYQNFIVSTAQGSASQASIKLKDIFAYQALIPPLSEQKAIVSVLGALDDKIENNRRMNETLEEMARAIFKSWFVDFDPVHAKAAGNAPAHMDAETAALFPSSFGDDGLPIGFNSKTLKDGDTELESGKRPKGGIDKSLHEGIPSIGAESLQKIGDFEYSKVKFVGKEFAEKSSKGWVQNYDVAIYKDGANVGDPTRVGLFGNGFPFDRFMVNEHVFLLRSKELGQPFLYSLCQSEMLSHQLKSMGTSKAAQPGLNQQEVLSCEYIAPPQALISAFNKLISPLIDRRLCLGLENQTLAELRDTLLPKLMSGEIRVADAEREVEALYERQVH